MNETLVVDEVKAHVEAMRTLEAELETQRKTAGLRQRLELAKSMGASGQAKLFADEIDRIEKDYRLDHQNPYPQVTIEEARKAMCEPIEPNPMFLDGNSRNALRAVFNRQTSFNAGTGLGLGFSGGLLSAAISFDPQYKYDLRQEMLIVDGHGSLVNTLVPSELTLLPMAALCRLKEAIDKKLFDRFEVWRPVEWKAPDPWLVGVSQRFDSPQRNFFTYRYFKLCDWR